MNNNSNNNLPTVGAQTAMNQDTTECVSIVKCTVEESRHCRLYPLVLTIPDNCDQDQNNGFIPWHLPSGHLPLSGIRIRTMGTFSSDGAGYQLASDPLNLTSDGSSCPGISTNRLILCDGTGAFPLSLDFLQYWPPLLVLQVTGWFMAPHSVIWIW